MVDLVELQRRYRAPGRALHGRIRDARAPIAVVVMAAEATRDPWMLIPAALATGMAYLVVGQETIYRSQPSRGIFGQSLHGHIVASVTPREAVTGVVRLMGQPAGRDGG